MQYSVNAKRHSWQDVCAILMDLHAKHRTTGVSATIWVDKDLLRETSRLCADLDLDEFVSIETGTTDPQAVRAADFLALPGHR